MSKIKKNNKKKANIAELMKLMMKVSEGNSENITSLIGATEGLKRLLSVLFEYVKKVHPQSEISHITVDEYCARYVKKANKNSDHKEPLRILLRELMDVLRELDKLND